MAMLEWDFEPVGKRGGATPIKRVLEESGFDPDRTFVRETMQNATDAQRDDADRTHVVLRGIPSGSDVGESVRQLLALGSSGGPVERGFARADRDLGHLYVEDWNTVGLTGVATPDQVPELEEEDHFARLCWLIGVSHSKEEGRAGTFGIGKSALWRASSASTVILYSRFAPSERTDGIHSRLIGVGWYDNHGFEGTPYTGRAWLGRVVEEEGEQYPLPIVDEEADRLAEEFGFPPRSSEAESGTSILIPFSPLANAEMLIKLKRVAETNFWPRLVDGELSAEFAYDGETLPSPSPESREDLADYIAAYELARGRREEAAPGSVARVGELDHRTRGTGGSSYHLGKASVVVPQPLRQEGREAEEGEDEAPSGLAMIRAPKMVVWYYDPSRSFPDIQFGAVFVASEEVDSALQASEPLKHNDWDPKAGDLSDEKQKIVSAVRSKARGFVADFLAELKEEQRAQATSCAAVGREFAHYLLAGSGGGGNGASPRDVRIQFEQQPERISGKDGRPRIMSQFVVWAPAERVQAWADDNDAYPERLMVRVRPVLTVDFGRSSRREVELDVLTDEAMSGSQHGNELELPLEEDRKRLVKAITAPLPSNSFTVDFQVEAWLDDGGS